MPHVVVTSIADADTADIISYLAAEAGQPIAARYVGFFEVLYDRLALYPDSGALRPALGTNVRISIVSPFIVIYEHHADTDTVTILRILHGNRHITARLLPS